jgi:5,10-methylenetetrahydrofolate reductase
MISHTLEGACAFAWRNYLLLHGDVPENDRRRSALYRYVTDLRDTGEHDFDLLQVAAVTYLNSMDELKDDRTARLAADIAVTKCLERRAAA